MRGDEEEWRNLGDNREGNGAGIWGLAGLRRLLRGEDVTVRGSPRESELARITQVLAAFEANFIFEGDIHWSNQLAILLPMAIRLDVIS